MKKILLVSAAIIFLAGDGAFPQTASASRAAHQTPSQEQRVKRDCEPLALFVAAWGGTESIVRRLLKEGADVNQVDDCGRTALLGAAVSDGPKIVELLIEAGADVNAANPYGFTPLMLAADNSDLKTVKILVEAGANANAKSRSGMTPLYMALRNLCDKGTGCKKTYAIVQVLIDNGADIHAVDEEGHSILMVAAALGHLEVVKLLLSLGADVNKTNNRGDTALCSATSEGFPEIAELLKANGAQPCPAKDTKDQ